MVAAPGQEQIHYFEQPEIPGRRFFRCEVYSATISTPQCARMWEGARDAAAETNYRCRGCAVGAAHAGAAAPTASSFFGVPLCPRCRRTGLRLISDEVCVSCYNRAREFKIGRNAKGQKPVKITALPPRSVAYHDGDKVQVHRRPRTLDSIETVFAVLRKAQAAVAFGFMSAVRGAGA